MNTEGWLTTHRLVGVLRTPSEDEVLLQARAALTAGARSVGLGPIFGATPEATGFAVRNLLARSGA